MLPRAVNPVLFAFHQKCAGLAPVSDECIRVGTQSPKSSRSGRRIALLGKFPTKEITLLTLSGGVPKGGLALRYISAQGQRATARGKRDVPGQLSDSSFYSRQLCGGRGLPFSRWVRNFARDERGSVTIEAVLWLPFFFGLLMLTTDASLAFYGQARAFRTIQDANRALSVGRYTTTDETEAAIEKAFRAYARNAAVTTTTDDGIVTTVMRVPMTDFTLFNSLGVFNRRNMTIQARHFLE